MKRKPKGLALSVKPEESVIIALPSGEQIVVSVGRIAPHAAVLVFDAPITFRILREELLEGAIRCPQL